SQVEHLFTWPQAAELQHSIYYSLRSRIVRSENLYPFVLCGQRQRQRENHGDKEMSHGPLPLAGHVRVYSLAAMLVRPRTILAMALATQALAPANDFWTAAEPGQWSEAQIKKIVTDSPWARQARVSVKGAAMSGVGRSGPGVPDDGAE